MKLLKCLLLSIVLLLLLYYTERIKNENVFSTGIMNHDENNHDDAGDEWLHGEVSDKTDHLQTPGLHREWSHKYLRTFLNLPSSRQNQQNKPGIRTHLRRQHVPPITLDWPGVGVKTCLVFWRITRVESEGRAMMTSRRVVDGRVPYPLLMPAIWSMTTPGYCWEWDSLVAEI